MGLKPESSEVPRLMLRRWHVFQITRSAESALKKKRGDLLFFPDSYLLKSYLYESQSFKSVSVEVLSMARSSERQQRELKFHMNYCHDYRNLDVKVGYLIGERERARQWGREQRQEKQRKKDAYSLGKETEDWNWNFSLKIIILSSTDATLAKRLAMTLRIYFFLF